MTTGPIARLGHKPKWLMGPLYWSSHVYRVPTGRLYMVLFAHFMSKMCTHLFEVLMISEKVSETWFPCSRWIHIAQGGQIDENLTILVKFDAGLRRRGQNMTYLLSIYGIGAIYDRKPFWLTGPLAGCAQIGYGGCPKVRNLGCGGFGGTHEILKLRG